MFDTLFLEQSAGGITDGAIAGIVIGCVAGGLLFTAMAAWLYYSKQNKELPVQKFTDDFDVPKVDDAPGGVSTA